MRLSASLKGIDLGDFYKTTGDIQAAEKSYMLAISNYAKIKWYSASHKVAIKLENDDIAFVYAGLAGTVEKERKRQNRQKIIKKWLSYLKNE